MMDVNDLISASVQLFNEEKYAEAIETLHQAWDGITDKSTRISEQCLIQTWLGRCYFEQAMKSKDTDSADKLFKKAIKHYRKWLRVIKADGQNDVQKQINALSWLGRCYLEQAMKSKDTDSADKLFKKAIKHYRKWLRVIKADGQNDVQKQINALSWLGRCYLEQAMKSKDTDKADKLFGEAIKHYQEWLRLAKTYEQNSVQEQIYAQSWLGRCYLDQAMKSKDADKADKLLNKAVNHFQGALSLTEHLIDGQDRIRPKIYGQSGLGRCYLEQIKRNKSISEAEKFVKQAGEKFSAAYEQLSQLSDEEEKKGWEKTIRPGLRDSYYLREDWNSYFEKKKQEIQESLFKGKTSQPQDAVTTVLAVLHITPIELGFTPMAHYTSPHVCHILFGIGGNETASPMRLGSSTYMNDPSEGKPLLDLLNQQDLELENKADGASHNAFFTCFSSRANDLNQFRLYGKEGGVEASGCCLVFNKNGDWLREADVSAPFRSLSKMSRQNSDDLPKVNEYEKLPLYQVAYIAYKDEYIAEKKCGIWLSAPNKAFNLHQNLAKENLGSSIRFTLNTNINRFGIRLKPVGNEEWHQFRLEKLKEALEELIGFFKDKSAVSDDDKEALEYIRYLFKDFAFRDEEEFRLLVIKPIDSEEIEYCETTQSVYIPYADIRNQADEVILGTNYEKTGNQRKAEVFRYQMKQKCPDVKVSRSTLPINPPNK